MITTRHDETLATRLRDLAAHIGRKYGGGLDVQIMVEAADRIRELEAQPDVAENRGVEKAISEMHGPLWRQILLAEECYNAVCTDTSDENCQCGRLIDRIEAKVRAVSLSGKSAND